ncbi:MAG: tripartite tricarboxylate transporter substrate binding protein [Burkholderiales bacterium]|nr:tripartite tricarboxylate transporter substrate binding protein [Burkholderiales bacterium]
MKHASTLLLGLILALAAPWAGAQAFPAGPVRIIVPFQAGGLTDILARTVGQHMGEGLGVPVLIENRPGASGNIGADAVAKSPANGQTLLMGSIGTNAVNQLLFSKMPYDTVKDFAPVSLVGYGTLLLVVHPSVPAKDLAELLALARAKPGALTYASGGAGASQHLAGELLKSMAKVDIVHVPYKGIAQGVVDLVAGQISMTFDLGTVMPHVKSGRLRPIAVANKARSLALPDVPTIAEAGLAGYEASAWYGLFAPAGTPREVVARLNAEAVRALRRTDVRDKLLAIGGEPAGTTPEEFSSFIAAEIGKWKKVVQEAKIRLD